MKCACISQSPGSSVFPFPSITCHPLAGIRYLSLAADLNPPVPDHDHGIRQPVAARTIDQRRALNR